MVAIPVQVIQPATALTSVMEQQVLCVVDIPIQVMQPAIALI